MKLCSLQIKAVCQKVHIIKRHKPAHKRKVFYSFTSERYRIHVSHCCLQHTCWDTLEKTRFCLLGSSQHQRLCILLPFLPSPQTSSTGIPVPGSGAGFGYSSSVDVPMPIGTQELLASLAACLPVFSIHSIVKREVARETLHRSIIHNWLPHALLFSLHWKTALGSC